MGMLLCPCPAEAFGGPLLEERDGRRARCSAHLQRALLAVFACGFLMRHCLHHAHTPWEPLNKTTCLALPVWQSTFGGGHHRSCPITWANTTPSLFPPAAKGSHLTASLQLKASGLLSPCCCYSRPASQLGSLGNPSQNSCPETLLVHLPASD